MKVGQLSPAGFEENQKGDYKIASICPSMRPSVCPCNVCIHPSGFCGSHISATAAPIHTNSSLIEASH